VDSSWDYFYSDRSADPWFGELVESYRVQERDPVPDTITPDPEDYYYSMRITSEDADLDDDGAIAATWGGTDCDDSDPTLTTATDEIPYDGIDQDCDGADLTDADADGADAIEAGGDDCDDTTGAIAPGRTEVCEDGLDNDCVGGDADCAEDVGGGDGEGVELGSGGCGCETGSASPAAGWLGMLALLVPLRRRR
jgi:MYXO-CTERM domain-containing protein